MAESYLSSGERGLVIATGGAYGRYAPRRDRRAEPSRASTRGIGAVVLVMCVAGAMAWGQVSGHDAHTKHTTGSPKPDHTKGVHTWRT